MIRNIVFDIGNVLVDFCWAEHLRNHGYQGETFDRIAKATVLSSAWPELDRGVVGDDNVIEMFVQNDPEMEEAIRKISANISGMLRMRDYAVPFVQELKEKGYQVYYLSNFAKKTFDESQNSLQFIPYMDGGVFSYLEKVIKPDPVIYETLLSRYGLVASECVFLDDLPENIEGAKNAGMKGIVFKNFEQALEELRELGVEV